ncbi:hypothetical protein GCM10010400_61710 [Streptomyces aculeolatus]|uniref:hypothetical protein n=1 Tax=Streptomyces aculeolatus TaxID=270689 RepID=UPI001CEC6206|nr:hypothetical protein [Streptomyces aculeolatus]
MTVSLSLVLILGVAVLAALKMRSVTLGAAVVAALFGFYVAGTDAAPTVNELVTALADAVRDIGT